MKKPRRANCVSIAMLPHIFSMKCNVLWNCTTVVPEYRWTRPLPSADTWLRQPREMSREYDDVSGSFCTCRSHFPVSDEYKIRKTSRTTPPGTSKS
eukprot:scaffold128336_cov75-Phaeocystis_antarctica.AAC.1